MATFYPDPNVGTNQSWIEKSAINGYNFRNWHLMFFAFIAFSASVILVCCCVRIRVPRTKQEIEADYRRKELARKFRERLRLIHNQDMDVIDLQRALEIIQQDYNDEKTNIDALDVCIETK